MRVFTKVLGVIIASTTLTALAEVTETESFSFELAEDGRISLENVNGDVRITGGSGRKVEIKADKRADNAEDLARLKVQIKAEPASIHINTVQGKSESRWFGNNNYSGQVTYTLTVPANARLDTISTVNGAVEISGVSSTTNVESVNGDLLLQNLMGDADLSTTNGTIEAHFEVLQGSQRIDASTVNGRITLHLPESASARLSAETINGSINAEDFGLEVDSGGFVGKALDGSIGSGEARIDLDTVNGGIRVRKR